MAQPLLDASFLDFVADIRATKHPRMFPHLGVGHKQKTGQPRGKGYCVRMVDQFSSHTRSLGIEKGVAMHSFRHTISTALRVAKVPDETVAQITGHARREDYPALQRHYHHFRRRGVAPRSRRRIGHIQAAGRSPGAHQRQIQGPARRDSALGARTQELKRPRGSGPGRSE